jgi:Domain of unknown function (DUF5658)
MPSCTALSLPAAAAERLACLLQDRRLRLPVLAFVVAQLLDIITTSAGLLLGLGEANPLTAGVLHHFGVAGLVAQKVPVVLGTVGGLAILPRRVALVAAWGFALLVAVVVGSNLSLVVSAHQA